MDLPPTLSVLDRFAQIMDELCAALLAQVAPRTWFGRLFGIPARPLVLRFCAEMRGLSEFFRSIAAGLAVDPPVVPASCGSDAVPCADRCAAPRVRGKVGPVAAAQRTTSRVSIEASAPDSPCALARPAVPTTGGAVFRPARDRVAAAGRADSVHLDDATGGVFFDDWRAENMHAHFVTI